MKDYTKDNKNENILLEVRTNKTSDYALSDDVQWTY